MCVCVCVCVCLCPQVVSCQWTLVIHLFEFQNSMNVITTQASNGEREYCCCDEYDEGSKSKPASCKKDKKCKEECDTFFVLNVYNGSSEPFSISTIAEPILNSPPHSLYIGYTFPFPLDDFPSLVIPHRPQVLCV